MFSSCQKRRRIGQKWGYRRCEPFPSASSSDSSWRFFPTPSLRGARKTDVREGAAVICALQKAWRAARYLLICIHVQTLQEPHVPSHKPSNHSVPHFTLCQHGKTLPFSQFFSFSLELACFKEQTWFHISVWHHTKDSDALSWLKPLNRS